MTAILVWDLSVGKGNDMKPRRWLLYCILAWVVTLHLPLLYFFAPAIYPHFTGLFYFALLIRPVFFYHFIFDLTHASTDRRFPYGHYIIPVLVALLALILLFAVPYEEQLQVVVCRDRLFDRQSLYGIFFDSKASVKLLFEVFYMVSCFVSLRRYRKFIANYASNESKFSLQWLYQYIWALILPLYASVMLLILPRDEFLSSPLVSSPLFIMTFLLIYIVYHTLKGHYVIPEADETGNWETDIQDRQGILKKSLLTREYFEKYINARRPYLNPDLKITDLVDDLRLNRTYISGFINREYGVNFSRFINQRRFDEYNSMLTDPALKNKSTKELIVLAGFGSYRYFRKLEKEQAQS